MELHKAYWLAALIDGEGSIIVRRKGPARLTVTITIGQNDRRLLERAVEYARCGAIYANIGPRQVGHQLQIFRQVDVARLLTILRPILVLKSERAEFGLRVLRKEVSIEEWVEWRNTNSPPRYKNMSG